MTVCWDSKLGPGPLRPLVAYRLREAGYILVDHNCDFALSWAVRTQRQTRGVGGGRGTRPGGVRAHYSKATLVAIRDGTIVDEVHWRFGEFDIPQDEPDRLAILFVNWLNASPKVAALPFAPPELVADGE